MADSWYDDDGPGCPIEIFGCVMPGRCLMLNPHYPSDCHNLEMIEAMEAEAEAEGGER